MQSRQELERGITFPDVELVSLPSGKTSLDSVDDVNHGLKVVEVVLPLNMKGLNVGFVLGLLVVDVLRGIGVVEGVVLVVKAVVGLGGVVALVIGGDVEVLTLLVTSNAVVDSVVVVDVGILVVYGGLRL